MSRLPITRAVRLATDYRAALFEDVDINLFDLHVANNGAGIGLISDRTFRGCRIQGPAIMLVSAGVVFETCKFSEPDGDMRNLVLRPAGPRALGTIPVRDCLFEECEFHYVGFTGSEPVIADLLRIPAGGQS
ncbi:hypothetical protein BH09PSE1_BH09PSE1_26020 [soil metagenome]